MRTDFHPSPFERSIEPEAVPGWQRELKPNEPGARARGTGHVAHVCLMVKFHGAEITTILAVNAHPQNGLRLPAQLVDPLDGPLLEL